MAREVHRSSEILEAVALLVVDMQDSLLSTMDDAVGVKDRCAFAIEAACELGIKVIFTEQVPQKLGHTNQRLLSRAPQARVFQKNTFSALQAEGLHEYLRKIGVYHLLIAGIETPVCIYQTALHAQDSELDVTVMSDCVAGRRSDDSIVVLESLARAECHVLPSETVFYSMLGSSANPRFRIFNHLVKHYGQSGSHEFDAPELAPAPDQPREREPDSRNDERRGRQDQRQNRNQQPRDPRDQPPADEQRRRKPADASGQDSHHPAEESHARGADDEHEDHDSDFDAEPLPRYDEPAESDDSTSVDDEPLEPAQSSSGPKESDDSEESTSEATDSSKENDPPDGDGQPTKKRPRRRRGGVRRRRARERAAARGTNPAENAANIKADGGASDQPPAASDA